MSSSKKDTPYFWRWINNADSRNFFNTFGHLDNRFTELMKSAERKMLKNV